MSSSLKLYMLRVGACRHLECMAVRNGRWRLRHFPALCGLIRHPSEGWILFDTGYAEHFFTKTEVWPERMYRSFLPVSLPSSEELTTQLAHLGLKPNDITRIIISHYHGDHIAGLRDFPNARFLALNAGTEHFLALAGKRWRATLQGYLPELLPANFSSRLRSIDSSPIIALPQWLQPFASGLDLLGDGSLLGVTLPGHSVGQLGLFLPDVEGQPVFLIADSAWSLPALRKGILPSPLTRLITADHHAYVQTFMQLHRLATRETAIALLPSHCNISWEKYLDAS